MKTRKVPLALLTVTVLAVVALLLAPAVAQTDGPQATPDTANLVPPISSDSYLLGWTVQAGGAGKMSSTSFRLNATIGQPVIGSTQSTNFKLHAGFWQWFYSYVYLPLIVR